jgi:hypothetical protein
MSVNCGAYRFPVTLYYIASETSSAMGSSVPSFTTYEVFADVQEMSDYQRLKLGMNIDESAFAITCRKPVAGRPIKLVYNSVTYRVTSCKMPRTGDVIELTAVKYD